MRFIRLISVVAAMLPAAIINSQVNTDRVMRVGQTALYYDDYMVAIQHFNRVIEAKPYMAQPYFMRAIAKLNLEDYRGAEDDATLAIERNPFIADAYEVRGVARQNLGNLEGAIADYDRELTMLPENRSILLNKALAQEELKDYDGAAASYDRLLKAHPGFDNGYVGRARLNIVRGDTLGAIADLDRAISINRNIANAYTLRAGLAIDRGADFAAALEDINEAIKLLPKHAGLYINRAFLRYKLDDYPGAMADYDYAISLDPLNSVAYYNRGLLMSEVAENDKAVADFSRVLEFDPGDYRALYNRAMTYAGMSRYDRALTDINKVIELTPDVAPLYFFRSSLYERAGDNRRAAADYDRGLELARRDLNSLRHGEPSGSPDGGDDPLQSRTTPEQMVANLYNKLLTVNNDNGVDTDYNNKNIRGKVQDNNVDITLEPMYALSYSAPSGELSRAARYIGEVDRINAMRALPGTLYVSCDDAAMTDEADIKHHFGLVDEYTRRIDAGTPRAIDYFGRALSLTVLRDYSRAIDDYSRAIELSPDFTLAYMMRAVARSRATDKPVSSDSAGSRADAAAVMNDLDMVISRAPGLAIAYYNKGNALASAGDTRGAISCYDEAVRLAPDLGEAYYNRANMHLRLGDKTSGIADLSRAGQLGVMPSYSLLKRINR